RHWLSAHSRRSSPIRSGERVKDRPPRCGDAGQAAPAGELTKVWVVPPLRRGSALFCGGPARGAGGAMIVARLQPPKQKGPAIMLGPMILGWLPYLPISFSAEQNPVRDPWRRSALIVFGLGRNLSLHLAASAHDQGSIPSGQVQCWTCLWLRLGQQLGMQRM